MDKVIEKTEKVETNNESKVKEKDIKKRTAATKIKDVEKEISPSISDLEGKFLLVKVGNKENPASNEDISDIEKKLIALFTKNNVNCLAFVTHHAVTIDMF
jgi:hypothetical protein